MPSRLALLRPTLALMTALVLFGGMCSSLGAQASAGKEEGQVAETPKADSRVSKALDQLELRYEIDEDGDFKLLFEVENERTQLVYIISATEDYRNLKVREIWSFAYETEGGAFPAPVANMLLEDTFDKKLGAWTKVGNRATFITRLPADADADTLYSTVMITMHVADQMEQRLTPDLDKF